MKEKTGPREIRINIRLSKLEGAAFHEIAKSRGLRPATLARKIIQNEKLPEPSEVVALMKEQIRSWTGALSNLNQIAKRMNTGSKEQEEALDAIREVMSLLRNAKRR